MNIILVQSSESEVCHMARLGMLNLYIASIFLFRICVYILLCACVHLCDCVRLSHTRVPYMHGRISSVSLHPPPYLRQHLCVSRQHVLY